MDSLISTFHIDWKIIIAQVMNLGIVFLVLYLFALKPLKKIMSDREEKISKGIADANANDELLQKTEREYAEMINRANAEVVKLVKQGRREAEIKKAEIVEQAQKEVEALMQAGKKNLEMEKAKIIEEARKEIVSLVVKATEKVLADSGEVGVDENTVKKIINL
jgi:F-type H+-transporting ATPase subunit b